MRVLAITQIWPNRLEPLSSPFNRQQFRALAGTCDLTVVCAIASFPGASLVGRFGALKAKHRAVQLAALPSTDVIDGIATHNMRQLYVPKYGVPVAVPLYGASLVPYTRLAAKFDIILATWAYPDGCAAVLFAKALGKPCVVKVHGTDVNLVAKLPAARTIVRRVLPRADAVVAVSRALGEELERMGVPRGRIELVENGVDATLFSPRERGEARRALGIAQNRKVILFVGRLEPQKGIGELLAAFERVRRAVPEATLVLVGEGVSRPEVDAHRAAWGDALIAPGARPLREVATYLAACDVFTLPSWMEGTPNVVLEALASGRPVVGSDVGGIPDVLRDPRSGTVVPARNADALAEGLRAALLRSWDASEVQATGPGSWEASAEKLRGVLERSLSQFRLRR